MNDQAHVDMTVLRMLQDVLEEGFAGLLMVFMRDSRAKLDSIRTGLAEADTDAVRSSAHTLKGSSANLGANPLAELCLTAEQQAREGNLDGLDELFARIEAEYQCVAAILEKRLEQL